MRIIAGDKAIADSLLDILGRMLPNIAIEDCDAAGKLLSIVDRAKRFNA
jgi:hypothetical protein